MNLTRLLKIIGIFLLAGAALAHASRTNAATTTPTNAPIESAHQTGPNGLEGWTESVPFEPDGQNYPITLVIAQHGQVIRRIDGDPLVWNWMFWNNGTQVAYQAGPLHFGLWCNLVDIASGKTLARLDCEHDLPKDAPAWEKALQP